MAASPRPGPRTHAARYSNTGFVIAGAVLERAAREPVARSMRRELFGHQGGAGLALQPAEQPSPPRAHPYWYPRGFDDPVDVGDGGPVLPFRSLAGVATTAGALAGDVPSLARWGHELLGGRILQPSSLRQMTRFHLGDGSEGYGLGLARNTLEDREVWGHAGDSVGGHAELWHVPSERLTIAASWNDDAIEEDGGIVSGLLHTALRAR